MRYQLSTRPRPHLPLSHGPSHESTSRTGFGYPPKRNVISVSPLIYTEHASDSILDARRDSMDYLFILNDSASGSERSYNGLRLTMALLAQEPETRVTVFLMGDAVTCAATGKSSPEGCADLEQMMRRLLHQGEVLLCGACMDARALTEDEICEGARRSSMGELAERTARADKVIVF